MSSLNESVVQHSHFPTSIETVIKDKYQQHHQQRSLPIGQIGKVLISPPVSVPWRLYKLSGDINVAILTGSSGIAANLMRNKKQLLPYCVAALSYARIYSERNWKPEDIDKIVDIGWNINRRTLMKQPMKFDHQTELNDVTDVFYIDSIKFVTLTKASVAAGIIDVDDLDSAKDFFRLLQENGQQSCVVEFNKMCFSFWMSDDKYYLFQPMHFYQKSPKCVEFTTFECVQKYLQKMLIEVEPQAEYAFYSVDILKVNNQVLKREEMLQNFYRNVTGKRSANSVNFGEESGVGLHKVHLHSTQNTTQTSYERLDEDKYVLRCPKSVDRSAKVSSACVAAIVVLRVDKASSWTSDTLSDILALGSKIYKENLKSKPKSQTEIRVSDIVQKVEYRSFKCLIESQQTFFGKVESTVPNVCNMEQGLTQFFMVHLAGVIDGPNIVAVWTENNWYYMYDAKARNRFGRKLTKEENTPGMSCVTRYQQLKDLAEVYAANVAQKERQDYYKITHVELKPFLGKDWFQWKVSLPGQWCLRGLECRKSNENLCVSVSALLYAEDISMKNWKPKTIDEIVSTGTQNPCEFNGERNLKETKMEIPCKEKTSFVTIKPKMFRYVVNELDKNIENDLVKGFTMFFEANKNGVFSFNVKKSWKYISVWRSSSNWFAFGVHVICDEDTGNEKKEILCGLRFTSQIDLVKSLTANIIIRKNQEFCLCPVNLNDEDPKLDKKKTKNYKSITVSKGCAGILRIGKNFDLIGSEEDVPKNIYSITSVIALNLIKDCWTWSNYDVWDMLKISQKSFSIQFNELRKYFIKVGSTAIKVKDVQTLLGARKESATEISPLTCKTEVKNEIDETIENQMESKQLTEQKTAIEGFLNEFEKSDHLNAILNGEHLQLGLWKKDGAFFLFDLRDADASGIARNEESSKSACPYVAWFDTMTGLLEHIWSNLREPGTDNFEFMSFRLKSKVENLNHKSWYNFSPVDDASNQWMIRSLYGSLQNQCGIPTCIIALAFASTLQPSNWNSSMLDSALNYGMRLYRKSLKAATSTELKLNAIVSPFVIGCNEFSFTAGLLQCGANELNVMENAIASLFNHSDYGIVSSKGYSAAIWQQNNSFFIFDPQLNGMASLSRFSNISLISKHFLSHVRTGMTGVNVFEIFKISITGNMHKAKDCPVDIEAISRLTNRLTHIQDTTNTTTQMFSTNAGAAQINNTIINSSAHTASTYTASAQPQINNTAAQISSTNIGTSQQQTNNTIINTTETSSTITGNAQQKISNTTHTLSGSTDKSLIVENLPTECVVVAACVLGNYKNPAYWTSNCIDEILSLGEQIYYTAINNTTNSTTVTGNDATGSQPVEKPQEEINDTADSTAQMKIEPNNVHLQPDQMQGVSPFDAQSAVLIRMTLYQADPREEKKVKIEQLDNSNTEAVNENTAIEQSNVMVGEEKMVKIEQLDNVITEAVNDHLKTLTKFFELYDSAFLLTTTAAVTVWKKGGRFYLFYYQPVDIDGRPTNTGEPKAVLLSFTSLNELLEYLHTNFVGGHDLQDWFEIRSLEIDFVPLENCNVKKVLDQTKTDASLTNVYNSRLSGAVCQCSETNREHLEKHAALNLTAIVMSTIYDIKTWTDKSLAQIEEIGKSLYADGVIASHNQQMKIVELPQRLFIDGLQYVVVSVSDDKLHQFNEPTVTSAFEQQFASSATLYIVIDEYSFCVIEKEKIFYWYDPNGLHDANNDVRASICCFSSMEQLVRHMLEVNSILGSNGFQIFFVKIERL